MFKECEKYGKDKKFLVVVGSGNNGADGLVLCKILTIKWISS